MPDDTNMYPRVTAVLKCVGLCPAYGPEAELARVRGTALHAATHMDDEGDLDDASVDDAVRPYLEQWRKFRAELQPVIVGIEEEVRHEGLRYVGHLDRRVVMAGREGILDIKSGAEQPWHRLQLSGYSHAVKCKGGLPPRWAVYLTPEAYTLKRFDDDHSDWSAWVAAISLYHWRQRHGVG